MHFMRLGLGLFDRSLALNDFELVLLDLNIK